MGRPSKGPRRVVMTRLPVALVDRIDDMKPADRNAWITRAIEEKLERPQDG